MNIKAQNDIKNLKSINMYFYMVIAITNSRRSFTFEYSKKISTVAPRNLKHMFYMVAIFTKVCFNLLPPSLCQVGKRCKLQRSNVN